jgi:regulation of enolase protein 1 (concanavalin A-like superfamily)
MFNRNRAVFFKSKSNQNQQKDPNSPITNTNEFPMGTNVYSSSKNKQPFKFLLALKIPLFVLLFTLVGTVLVFNSFASTTRNNFLYTSGEITEYQRRMSGAGPFYKQGDAGFGGQYSPGDGQNSERLAADFLASPQASYWKQPALPYSSGDEWPCEKTTKEPCMRFMHAAWVYMTKPNHPQRAQLRDEVKKLMIYVSNEPTLNYANETNYNTNYPGFTPSPIFGHAEWMTRIIKARDMIGRDAFSSAENARFDRWLYDYSNWINIMFHVDRAKHLPGRLSRDYSKIGSSFYTPSTGYLKGYDGGPGIGYAAKAYHNRNMEIIAASNLAANYIKYYGFQAPTSNGPSYGLWSVDKLLDHGRIAFEETLRFSIWPQGMQGDFERGDNTKHTTASAQQGWLYSANVLTPMMEIAKHHAKRGDMSVWNYSTTWGHEGTAGSPNNTSGVTGFPAKNVHFYAWTMSRYVNNDWKRTNRSEPLALSHQIHDIVPAAMAHQLAPNDNLLEAAWKRQGLNFPAYPQRPQSQGPWPATQGHGAKYIGLIEVGGIGPYAGNTSGGDPTPPPATDTTAPSVSITSPVNGSTVSGTLTISANASDNVGVSKVEFYRGSTLLRTDTGAPYTASWDTTTIANAGYDLTAKAYDAAGNVTTSSVVRVTVSNQVAQPLPAPWQNRDIGSTIVQPGSATANNGVVTMKVQSGDIWNNEDSFHYVYQPYSGDVTITARVTSLTETSIWAKAGVMIRESLDANSRHAMAIVTPARGTALQWRAETGGTSLNQNILTGVAPYWVQLTRQGSTITASSSANGSTWTKIASVEMNLPSAVYVGLPLTSNNPDALATAGFDNISVITPSAPADTTAPSVSLSAPSAGATLSGSVAISATASDNVGVSKVEFYRNDQLVVTDTSAPYGFSWDTTLVNDGSYSLSARAYDAAGNSTMSDAVSVTVKNASDADTSAPSVPGGLSGTAVSSSQINLQWNASTDNVGVAGYDVYRNAVRIATVSGTSFGDSGLPAGTTFSYYVVARDAAGNTSAASSVINVSTLAAPTPDPVSTGSVQGTVSSSSGGTLAGSKVTLTVDGRRSTYNTSADGFYAFTDLNAGDYRVEYDRSQHRAQSKTITIVSDRTATVNVVLESRR